MTITVGSAPGADFNNLEAAVAAATPGETIVLQAGTVNLEDPSAVDVHVLINKTLTVIGQGEASTTLLNVHSNPDATIEALHANDSTDRAPGAAIDVDGAGLNVQFLNFTFDGGDGPSNGGFNLGYGIFFNNG